VKIAFTSSSSIDVVGSRSDLSRRLSVLTLPPFSFREYLLFKNGTELPILSLDEILSNHAQIYRKLYGFESEFREFCTQGALPACLESPLPSVVRGLVEKAVQRDMLSSGKLSQEDLVHIRQALLFIARAGADGCSYSSISKNTGITKYKAQQYASLLSSASLAKVILPYGANVMPEPKILLTLTIRANLAEGVDEDRLKGTLREEFFVHHVAGAGLELNYLKGARGQKLADYVVFYKARKLIFEIGGAGKGASQFKGISAKEKFILSQPGSARGIPLILLGFLW
jgi:predicted AAA+ superfamily ATPase